MKYSNYLGAFSAVAVILTCFAPWVFIGPLNLLLTGFHTPGTNFGKPGLMNVIISSLAMLLFLIPQLWAKRTNLFICSFNLAWSIRNFLLVSHCEMGECPETKWGIYALVAFSIVMMIMSLLPKVKVQ